ncbi:UDP-N-acetylglucosamine 2-epimerase [Enterococcus phoeniculicola]|nr:UDP-N-acetylglucosamine 2-epimerase [Enterococcus phoeniculicola]
MAPLVKALAKDPRFDAKIAVTAQHREMLDQVMNVFDLTADYDLNIMKSGQTLTDITTRILTNLKPVLEAEKPDVVLVHGDTTTAYATATAAFYQQISVGHVEAGLRTWNKWSPFPEEMNRQLIDVLSDLYFAPTKTSAENLLKENHPKEAIFVTGNTAIDAMKYTVSKTYSHPDLPTNLKEKKLILVTMHRRENLGESMHRVFRSIRKIAEEHADIVVVFPMHKNPQVRKEAREILGTLDNVHLIEPLDVVDFHNFAARSYLILTDSGGVQEEAPSLGVPVLVLRDTTERPEGVSAGTLKLVGTDQVSVYQEIIKLLDPETHKKMCSIVNPYGDGNASQKIIDGLVHTFSSK